MELESIRIGISVVLVLGGGLVALALLSVVVWMVCGYDCVTGSRKGRRELARIHAKPRARVEPVYTVEFDEAREHVK